MVDARSTTLNDFYLLRFFFFFFVELITYSRIYYFSIRPKRDVVLHGLYIALRRHRYRWSIGTAKPLYVRRSSLSAPIKLHFLFFVLMNLFDALAGIKITYNRERNHASSAPTNSQDSTRLTRNSFFVYTVNYLFFSSLSWSRVLIFFVLSRWE